MQAGEGWHIVLTEMAIDWIFTDGSDKLSWYGELVYLSKIY